MVNIERCINAHYGDALLEVSTAFINHKHALRFYYYHIHPNMYTIYLISIFIYLVCLSVDIADFAGLQPIAWTDRHEIRY